MSRKPKTAPAPLTAVQHRQEIIKLLRANTDRRNLWDVFGDFVEMGAIAIANAADWKQAPEREKRYMAIAKRYEKEEIVRFPMMLGHLAAALELQPSDVLGSIFGELEIANKHCGQFFTPYPLCQVMAKLTVDPAEARKLVKERGFIAVMEPAVGAGAAIVALAEHLLANDINYQRVIHVTAIDVDSRAVHMAYLQFSLLHIPAVVIVGNTLTLEQREVWYTPAHIMDGWTSRLRKQEKLGKPMVLMPKRSTQHDMFGDEAA